MRHNGGDPYPNDPTIKHRVESEILGRDPFNTAQINVGVEDGIVVLHGQVDDHTTRRALAFAVSRVDGVRGVRNNLHTADEPAPTAPGQS